MRVNPNIFKAYDIRGIYGTELDEDIAYKIGRGFAFYLKTSPIIVGYDTRLSSSALKTALINGLTDQGAQVVDIGLCSTPCFYFTAGNPKFAGGIMVTASHASKEFNGFKPVSKGNTALSREQILELKEIAKTEILDKMSIICITGKDIQHNPEILERIFSLLKKNNINIELISQGASSISISIVVKQEDSNKAIKELHKEFFENE